MENHGDIGANKKVGWRKIIGRVVITALFGGLVIASAFPTLYGSLRIPSDISSFKQSFVSTCNTTCTDYTGDVLFLQQQLKSSRDEVLTLSGLVNELQGHVQNEQAAPVCSSIQLMEFNSTEIMARQEDLHETMRDLLAAIEQRKFESATLIEEHSTQRQQLYDNLANSIESLSGEIYSLQEVLNNKTNEANILSTISEISLTVSQAIGNIHEQQIAQINEISKNITGLKMIADSFTCPEPIIPVIVEPVVFRNCSDLPATAAPAATTTDSDVNEKSELTITQRECVDISSAQTIVTNMVNNEIETLSHDLTQYCDKSSNAAVAEFHRIVADKVESAVEDFITETTRLHAEHAEYLTETVSKDCLNTIATTTSSNKNNVKSVQNTEENGIPELDYALIASGSRIVSDQTSDTYFPKQWHLTSRLKDSLNWLGVSVDDQIAIGTPASAVGEMLSAMKIGSGMAIYEGLNLHKTVGVPEDALRVDGARTSNCWPMEVRLLTTLLIVIMCVC